MRKYINTMTFADGTTRYRRGEEHPDPKPEYIRRGFVREVKVVEPEVKHVRAGKRKSADKA